MDFNDGYEAGFIDGNDFANTSYEEGYTQAIADSLDKVNAELRNDFESLTIAEDAGLRLAYLVLARVFYGPTSDNELEENIESTFEEFMDEVDEEGADEDEYVD